MQIMLRALQHVLIICLFALGISAAAAQTCRWDGAGPFCNGTCGDNEVALTNLAGIPDFWVPPFVTVNPPFGASCVSGTKALCCATSGRTCRWEGTAPFCNGGCPGGWSAAQPPPGSDAGYQCWTGSKTYCCHGDNLGVTGAALTARNCTYGSGTCVQGFVWREATAADHVCVTPQVRDATRNDNAQAAARRSPNGGPYGPDTCAQGYVWREAFSGDHVCVSPQTRSQANQDNHWAQARNACP